MSSLGGGGNQRSIFCWINVWRLRFYTEQTVAGRQGLVRGRKLENHFYKQMPGDTAAAGCGYGEQLIGLESSDNE